MFLFKKIVAPLFFPVAIVLLLVTSASHMPRSMILFKKLGMHPIPAPTEYQVKGRRGTSPKRFYPTADGLMKAERAFYEYIGLVWTKMRGIREKM